MKNYKCKIKGLEVAYFWQDGKDGKPGNYSVSVTRSFKDKDGNWKDQKIYLDAHEAVLLGRMLERTEQVALRVEEFQKNS